MDFSQVRQWTITEGNVVKVELNGVVVWQSGSGPEPVWTELMNYDFSTEADRLTAINAPTGKTVTSPVGIYKRNAAEIISEGTDYITLTAGGTTSGGRTGILFQLPESTTTGKFKFEYGISYPEEYGSLLSINAFTEVLRSTGAAGDNNKIEINTLNQEVIASYRDGETLTVGDSASIPVSTSTGNILHISAVIDYSANTFVVTGKTELDGTPYEITLNTQLGSRSTTLMPIDINLTQSGNGNYIWNLHYFKAYQMN